MFKINNRKRTLPSTSSSSQQLPSPPPTSPVTPVAERLPEGNLRVVTPKLVPLRSPKVIPSNASGTVVFRNQPLCYLFLFSWTTNQTTKRDVPKIDEIGVGEGFRQLKTVTYVWVLSCRDMSRLSSFWMFKMNSLIHFSIRLWSTVLVNKINLSSITSLRLVFISRIKKN